MKSIKAWMLLCLIAMFGCTSKPDDVEPVNNFALQPYLGKWYELDWIIPLSAASLTLRLNTNCVKTVVSRLSTVVIRKKIKSGHKPKAKRISLEMKTSAILKFHFLARSIPRTLCSS